MTWADVFGEVSVESRQLQRLPGCPFPMAKGRVTRERHKLAQALRLLADSGRALVVNHQVMVIERSVQSDTNRRLWRLVKYGGYA